MIYHYLDKKKNCICLFTCNCEEEREARSKTLDHLVITAKNPSTISSIAPIYIQKNVKMT